MNKFSRPRIFVITGSNGSGKTTFAHNLAAHYKHPLVPDYHNVPISFANQIKELYADSIGIDPAHMFIREHKERHRVALINFSGEYKTRDMTNGEYCFKYTKHIIDSLRGTSNIFIDDLRYAREKIYLHKLKQEHHVIFHNMDDPVLTFEELLNL